MLNYKSIILGVALVASALTTANPALAAKDHVKLKPGEVWVNGQVFPASLVRRQVPEEYRKKVVSFHTDQAPGTIIIDTPHRFLYLVTSKDSAIRYGVGVGRDGMGWSGVVRIGRKVEWPTWNPPKEMRAREAARGHFLPVVQEGGPENPLGARAMYLFKGNRDTIFRIHGTNAPWSIGLNLSSGCIRMMNEDVTDLYSRVDVGTKVIVIGPGNKAGKVVYEDGGIDFFRSLFGG